MQYNSVQYQQYDVQLCSSLMAACLYSLLARTVEILLGLRTVTSWLVMLNSFSSCCWQTLCVQKIVMEGCNVDWRGSTFYDFLKLYLGKQLKLLFVDRGCPFWPVAWWINTVDLIRASIVVIIAVTSFPKRQNFPSLIITFTKFSNMIGYQLFWFQH